MYPSAKAITKVATYNTTATNIENFVTSFNLIMMGLL